MTEDEIEKRVTELHAQCAAEPDMVRRYELRDQIAPLEKQLDAFRLVRARKFLADMDARRAATASTSPATSAAAMPPASAKPTPPPPAPSATEVAARRRAETSALWKKVVGQVNEERFGREPDRSPDGAVTPGGGQKSSTTLPSTRAIWSKAVAAANAGIAGGEPSASREGQAPSNGHPQTGSDFLSGTITAAGKQLKDAGFAVVR